MLVRRYTKMIQLGWFGLQPKASPIPALAHGAISRDIAEQSMVLLKNDGNLLPLNRAAIKSVALIGPYAVRQMTGGGGSSHVIPLYSIAPVDGLDAALLSQTKITLLDGNDIDAAVAVARKTDVAILMVGDDEGEDHDHSIALPAEQDRLIEAVAKANPKTVVVLKSGSAVLMPWLQDVPAVFEAWYPGEEDGTAVAAVLLGAVNPSGKLPLTFPRSLEDTLASKPDQFPGDGTTVHYSEGLEVGYRAYYTHNVVPLFPFGFGLSYTTFKFDDLKITTRSKANVTVSFRITNTGLRSGAEVAQLYIDFPEIAEGNEPLRQLKGFRKVMLQPGESQSIELALTPRSFSYWSVRTHGWQIAPGTFQIMVGDSSANTPLKSTLDLQ
jgi:beta-glucosidase